MARAWPRSGAASSAACCRSSVSGTTRSRGCSWSRSGTSCSASPATRWRWGAPAPTWRPRSCATETASTPMPRPMPPTCRSTCIWAPSCRRAGRWRSCRSRTPSRCRSSCRPSPCPTAEGSRSPSRRSGCWPASDGHPSTIGRAPRRRGAIGLGVGGSARMLLDGKKLLITGVLTDDSIAFAIARVAQEAGAEIVLTNVGRGVRLTEKVAKRLPTTPDVLEMDVNNPEQIEAVRAEVMRRWGRLDGVVHAIGFMPADGLGGNFLNTPWESVAFGFQTSAYSLKALSAGLVEPMKAAGSASVVSLTFDGRFAWPIYDWMGVAKAGLEATARYLARDLGEFGIRVNTVSAGPIRTMAGKSIPGFDQIADTWLKRAPLGWSMTDATAVGQMVCFLLSDWATMTSGELIHVDGGYHAMGTDIRA